MSARSSDESPRRGLLAEARVLLRYVSDQWPDAWTCRLYVRAVEKHATRPAPIALPRLCHRFPRLLALWDDTAFAASASTDAGLRDVTSLTGRLYVAFAVAEASPRLADRFVRGHPMGRVAAVVSLAGALALEWLLLGLAAARHLVRRRVARERGSKS